MDEAGGGQTARKSAKINNKRLTSLITLATFLVMTITGIVLYFVPEGRVAYWVNWKFLGLTKTGWGNIHIISSIVFAVAGVFHLYFNWRPLANYLSGKLSGGLKFNRELGLASLITALVIVGSIALFPPFNYIIDFGGYLKGTWVVSRDYEPPFGHAEDVSLKIFSRKMDIDLDKAVAELKSLGIKFDSVEEKLKDIAAANNITPMEVYIPIKKYEEKIAEEAGIVFTPDMVDEKFSGTGIGNKALSWIVEDIGADPKLAEERLAKNGIKIGAEESLKAAAARYGIEPIDILKIILVEDYLIRR